MSTVLNIRVHMTCAPGVLKIASGLRRVRFALAMVAVLTSTAAMAAQPGPECAWTLSGSGEHAAPRQFRGQVLYVDFWASWCAPCVLSFPFMNALDREFRSRGLQVVAVDMDERVADGQAFVVSHRPGFAIASAGSANAACARAFGVRAMPTSFLIDRSGAIRESIQGFHQTNEDHLRTMIGQLLSEPKPQQ